MATAGELGVKTFQKPLSKEEESLCIQALQAEDAGRKSEAKRLLIERNLRLVAHIAKKYGSSEEELEDLISIGTIGLIKAVETFDPQKNSRLAAYWGAIRSLRGPSPVTRWRQISGESAAIQLVSRSRYSSCVSTGSFPAS